MAYRFSANTGFLWRDLPFLERIARAGACGFDAVEFHDEAQRTPVADVRAALEDAGLPLVCLNTRMGGTAGCAALAGEEARAREDVAEALDLAGALGAGAVHLLAGRLGPDADPAAAEARYADALGRAAALAARQGIAVLVEPISRAAMPGYAIADIEAARRVVDRAGAPNARILFDCFHVATTSPDLAATFRAHQARVGHVQIAGGGTRAEPDGGDIDYAALLPALHAAGYRGAFGCEYRPRTSVEEGLGWRDRFAG